ncbi:hypothetical protein BDY19DRAFT_36348 [Irpex rosettiformis]|uniref:Uncharacterized protein n=1 Tax=Irpex rosettiformis TaxID=378272 RepID=A0ACB8UK20_9APHY|nr:hypothetical protein BDY19DRAFT_36348 [Irpex rosettiformis]
MSTTALLPAAADYTDSSVTSSKTHPSFNDANADISLCSSEGTIFRTHSLSLSLASGWFRSMFSLPQCMSSHKLAVSSEIIHLAESSGVIAGLLSSSSGQPIPHLDSFEYVEELLYAAEKYDMPSVISIIRLAIMSPLLLDAHPIRVYGIASAWGWTAEAKLASTKTIGWDLLSSSAIKDLNTVDSRHLTALLLLHRRRRDMFRAGLDSPVLFYANAPCGRCPNCQKELVHVQWTHMKHVWSNAIEQSPAAVVSKSILQHQDVHQLLGTTCQDCAKKLYDPEGTVAKLNELMDRLPTVVEF